MNYKLKLNTDGIIKLGGEEDKSTVKGVLEGVSKSVTDGLRDIKERHAPNIAEGIGLVFEGGGGKGAYEIGVWRALDELNISKKITAVSGSSVGALNGAMFASGDLNAAIGAWSSISNDAVLTPNQVINMLPPIGGALIRGPEGIVADMALNAGMLAVSGGIFSHDGLSNLIDMWLSMKSIRSFKGPVFATCTEQTVFAPLAMASPMTELTAARFDIRNSPDEEMKKILLASASIPVVFPKMEINGKEYVDGGLADNLPIRPVYDLGIRRIISVRLCRDIEFYGLKYPNAKVTEIMPSEDLGDLFSGTMNFDADKAKWLMELGYRDGMKALRNIEL